MTVLTPRDRSQRLCGLPSKSGNHAEAPSQQWGSVVMQSFLEQISRLTWLACLSLALPLAALAQNSARAQLPPAAQESIDKGMSAAKQQEWLVAIRYFGEAQTAAPESP